MFQTFEEAGSSADSATRVERLREELAYGSVDGFLVPRADEYQGEYIPAASERLRWLTGFTGSAGFAVVLKDRAAIFSDGRYTVQLAAQIDPAVFAAKNSVDTTLAAYLRKEAPGLKIGFDPWLHTIGEIDSLEKASQSEGFELIPLARNPIDRIWQNRPAPPLAPLVLHPEALAGESAADKRSRIGKAVEEAGADLTVLTDPASTAWLLNIRGNDVPHKPLALSFSVVDRQGQTTLFIDPAKVPDELRPALAGHSALAPLDTFAPRLADLAAGMRVLLDPSLVAKRIADLVENANGTVVSGPDPVSLPRARKNGVEIAGSRAAHRRDGAAVSSFLAWLDAQEPGSVGEISAAEKLEEIRAHFGRKDGVPLADISFDTISGAGPHAALPHYRVTRGSDRPLQEGELYLIDSGGQYRDGTTDVTRTVAIGEPSAEMRRLFTLVLKGMIAISTARFPRGTRGVDLDPLARAALWQAGFDYAHGTGHGVGSYLGVHEGPQSISRRGMAVLEEGMILSNEPGYYREGAFGIRIENLLLVQRPSSIAGGIQDMHGFETLSFAPIDRRLIDVDLLEERELAWLNDYHAQVRDTVSPLLDEETRRWLENVTRPLAR